MSRPKSVRASGQIVLHPENDLCLLLELIDAQEYIRDNLPLGAHDVLFEAIRHWDDFLRNPRKYKRRLDRLYANPENAEYGISEKPLPEHFRILKFHIMCALENGLVGDEYAAFMKLSGLEEQRAAEREANFAEEAEVLA